MSDSIKELTHTIRAFTDARGWLKTFVPKDLAMSISMEAAELLEHFQWVPEERLAQRVEERKGEISDEVADVVIYCLQFAERCGIDLGRAIEEKMAKNAVKYPLARSAAGTRTASKS